MKEYHKIETLYARGSNFKVTDTFRTEEFEYLKENPWEISEKIDGTNIRVMWDGKTVSFGGRTNASSIPAHLATVLASTFTPEAFVKAEMDPICLYGEGCGAKIQKGGGNYKADGCMFIMFDALAGSCWLRREDVEEIASRFGVTTAPIIATENLLQVTERVAKGFHSKYGPFMAEGVIVRPLTPLATRSGHRIIGKLKTSDFMA